MLRRTARLLRITSPRWRAASMPNFRSASTRASAASRNQRMGETRSAAQARYDARVPLITLRSFMSEFAFKWFCCKFRSPAPPRRGLLIKRGSHPVARIPPHPMRTVSPRTAMRGPFDLDGKISLSITREGYSIGFIIFSIKAISSLVR